MYKPVRPNDIDTRLKSITGTKAPHFFIHAKGKDSGRVQKINGSVVNQLEEIVPNKKLVFTAKNIGAFRFQYMLSEYRASVIDDPAITSLYDEVEKQYRYSISFYDDEANYAYIRDSILKKFGESGYKLSEVCDILVKYLFCNKQSKRKNVFWMCFGDIVYENLKHNLPDGSVQCIRCGERFIPSVKQQRLCHKCSTYQPQVKKKVLCADCGSEFEVDARNMKKIRCDPCQKEYRKKWDRERKRRKTAV